MKDVQTLIAQAEHMASYAVSDRKTLQDFANCMRQQAEEIDSLRAALVGIRIDANLALESFDASL